ncbi:MAG: hypothetical protein NUK62_08905 [Tenericutes bacterium]|nr:hypothetical protein [Mycoplasmatota bacterium]
MGSILSLVGFPLIPFITGTGSYDLALLGMGIFAFIVFLIVGFYNYNLHKSNLESEKTKDRKIESLEKELKNRVNQ